MNPAEALPPHLAIPASIILTLAWLAVRHYQERITR